MARKSSKHPTEVELEILKVLWSQGECSVRQIHEVVGRKKGTGYSTTLKMVQVMTEKGLLIRDESRKPQIYTAAIQEGQAQAGLLNELLDRAFSGSMNNLVLRALESDQIDQNEIQSIKDLISRHEEVRDE